MSINQGDRVLIQSKEKSLAYINGRIATVTASNRSGYYLKVDGLKPSVHLSNLQGMQCLDKLTSAQESVLDLPSQVYDPDLGWQDLPKKTHSVQKYSNLDTPEPPTMATSTKRKRGRPRKESTFLQPVPPVNPSATKGKDLDNKTPETASPTSEKSVNSSLLAGDTLGENAAKPSEISLTSELSNSPSILQGRGYANASSTTPKRLRSGLVLSEAEVAEVQLDLTTKIAWIDPDQLEEISFTQIRHSVDVEAIARYSELMRDNLWDFNQHPLPVLFEHENRYLIGDGHHRIEAARKLKLKIKCEIFTAWSIEDALLYSIRAIENSNHGIPLRPKDQRKRIGMFLDLLDSNVLIVPPEGYQEWSSRAIATYLRLPESGYRTVASIRKERIRATEEPLESWGITLPDIDTTTADTFTPPSIDTPADTYTPLSTFTPVNTTFQPSFIPADMPPLPTPPARLAAMVVVILEKIDELNPEQLIKLKEAIAAEEVRRLEQTGVTERSRSIEEEEKGSY